MVDLRAYCVIDSLQPQFAGFQATVSQESGVRLGELQGIDHAQHFVNVAAERQVIDHLVVDLAVLADQERTSVGNSGILKFDIIGLADLVLDVRNQGIGNRSDAAFVNRGVAPSDMGEL